MKRLPLILLPLLLLASCKVDFSPNGEWQEIPLVYCVLDQDDSLTVVRVQKAYLGEGDQYHYATIYDSTQYPEGALTVRLLGWPAKRGVYNLLEINSSAPAPQQVFECEYTLIEKEEGSFAGPQPVYTCVTQGQLDTGMVYQLVVLKGDDTLATAETYLIGDCNDMEHMLLAPSPNDRFNFSGSSSICNMKWYSLPRARQYQPYVLFSYHDFYRHFSDNHWDTIITPHAIRVNCNVVKSTLSETYHIITLAKQTFMTAVKDSILHRNLNLSEYENDPHSDFKLIPESTVDIFLPCCTEDLAAYLFAHQEYGGINQEPRSYTNIRGGLGVFAARRTHLGFNVPANMANSGGYIKGLKDLGVGF